MGAVMRRKKSMVREMADRARWLVPRVELALCAVYGLFLACYFLVPGFGGWVDAVPLLREALLVAFLAALGIGALVSIALALADLVARRKEG